MMNIYAYLDVTENGVVRLPQTPEAEGQNVSKNSGVLKKTHTHADQRAVREPWELGICLNMSQ